MPLCGGWFASTLRFKESAFRESALEKELTKLEDQIDQQNSLLDVSRDATDENLNLRLQLDELKLEHTRLAAFEKLGICSICVEEGVISLKGDDVF